MTRSDPILRLPGGLELFEPDGTPVAITLPEPGRHLVVQLVRYFGCLPCQEWLIEINNLRTQLDERGADVAAVGGSADYQAQWLRDERGVQMPLYLDPSHVFREAVEMGRPLGWRLANPRGVAAYARSLRHGFKPQRITKDTVRSPGVVIIDSEGLVVWRHEGERIGDYPPHALILDALERLSTSS